MHQLLFLSILFFAPDVEVDFIVYGPQGFGAIEVKNSKNVSSEDTI